MSPGLLHLVNDSPDEGARSSPDTLLQTIKFPTKVSYVLVLTTAIYRSSQLTWCCLSYVEYDE